jgi:lactate racemase-like protein
MHVIDELLRNVALPRMVRVRQIFPNNPIPDVEAELRQTLRAPGITEQVKPGMRIAVGVGSRGLATLPQLVHVLVDELKRRGAHPFIVPAMGSHGGATADGQVGMLEALGVTEASAGCPIVSSMDTIELGRLANGLPVLMDRHAMEADGIVVLNRVKPHTSFSGSHESGLVKMITIGLGKQKGADSCHARGFGEMGANIVEMARVKLAKSKILFGVATVENAYDHIARVVAVPSERILAEEVKLLAEAKSLMPSILFNPLNVLVVDEMGKEFSGSGMDPNITGRANSRFINVRQDVERMVVLDLSARTHGNATGMGLADICTRRLFEKIDFVATYMNHITATSVAGGKVPMIMESDQRAIQVAVRTCSVDDTQRVRMVRVPNTLHLENIEISEGLLAEAAENPRIEVLGPPRDWSFDAQGHLAKPERQHSP